jgi:hypothetical protein
VQSWTKQHSYAASWKTCGVQTCIRRAQQKAPGIKHPSNNATPGEPSLRGFTALVTLATLILVEAVDITNVQA